MKVNRYLMKKAREDSQTFGKIVDKFRHKMKEMYNERKDATRYVYEILKYKDAERDSDSAAQNNSFFDPFRFYFAEARIAFFLSREILRMSGITLEDSVLDI